MATTLNALPDDQKLTKKDKFLSLVAPELEEVSGKKYDELFEEIGHIMVYSYERNTMKMPGFARALMGKVYRSPKLLNKMLLKKEEKNAKNAAANPGSFETETQIPPESGYDFSYHNRVCSFW